MEYSIWYRSKRGASIGRFFRSENALVDFVSNCKRDAVIKLDGALYGRVWKDNGRWNWVVGEIPAPAQPETQAEE